MMTGQKHSSYH